MSDLQRFIDGALERRDWRRVTAESHPLLYRCLVDTRVNEQTQDSYLIPPGHAMDPDKWEGSLRQYTEEQLRIYTFGDEYQIEELAESGETFRLCEEAMSLLLDKWVDDPLVSMQKRWKEGEVLSLEEAVYLLEAMETVDWRVTLEFQGSAMLMRIEKGE